MQVRKAKRVIIREDPGFGGICYVPNRDDFFAANYDVFQTLKQLKKSFTLVPKKWEHSYRELAKLGICETQNPVVPEGPYSGPSFLGTFPEIPTIDLPLVVNCFSTSHCPLACQYCHADDLMQSYRANEISQNWTNNDLKNMLFVVSQVPAIVAVITGGDPLTRPERAIQLIQGLSKQKSIVLDTSGVGPIERMLPVLAEHEVHVRVSLDSLGKENDRWRPFNSKFKGHSDIQSSRAGALRTIEKCLEIGLSVTVQTVIHSRNDSFTQLIDLRDGLRKLGVKNWVLHLAIKGGLARKKEMEMLQQRKLRGSILPGGNVRPMLWQLIEETMDSKLNIDIRCTDTDSTPNSVLLINSEGNLYTEGYAHHGKVKLYDAKENRPDRVRALWSHIDKFGHARRYLNWNPWYYRGEESLEDICKTIPIPVSTNQKNIRGLVETEAKYRINKIKLMRTILNEEGFILKSKEFQRDEYYDTETRTLTTLDYVLRIRNSGGKPIFAFKGPRSYTKEGEYSRVELEFSAKSEKQLREEIENKNLKNTWYFEKKRATYIKEGSSLKIEIDQIPEIGYFLEVEGPISEGQKVQNKFKPALDTKETRNYRDIFIEFKISQGYKPDEIKGASFK